MSSTPDAALAPPPPPPAAAAAASGDRGGGGDGGADDEGSSNYQNSSGEQAGHSTNLQFNYNLVEHIYDFTKIAPAWSLIKSAPNAGANSAAATSSRRKSQSSESSRSRSRSSLFTTGYWRRIRWSPDGSLLLTNNADFHARVTSVPFPIVQESAPTTDNSESIAPAATSTSAEDANDNTSWKVLTDVNPGGETIYDLAWWPLMNVNVTGSSCFATTCKDQPIHLWDVPSGRLRASYVGYDAMDAPTSAISIAFDAPCRGSSRIFAGYNGGVKVFDLSRPGGEYDEWPTWQLSTVAEPKKAAGRRRKRQRIKKEGVRGVVSCLSPSPDGQLLAVGTYGGDGIGILDCDDEGLLISVLKDGARRDALTQVSWAPGGQYLFSAARHQSSGEILCWDVRMTQRVLGRFSRSCISNQRIGFDLDPLEGRWLCTGSSDGSLSVFDLCVAPDPDTCQVERAFHLTAAHGGESVNDVQVYPAFCKTAPFLISCSGSRRLNPRHPEQGSGGSSSDVDSDCSSQAAPPVSHSIQLWSATQLDSSN